MLLPSWLVTLPVPKRNCLKLISKGSPAAERALTAVVDDEVESLSALAAEGIAAAISSDNSVSREINVLESHYRYLDSILANDDYVFDSYEPVVEAAIAWYVSSNNES